MSGSIRKAVARLVMLAALTSAAAAILRTRRRGEVWHTLDIRPAGSVGDEGP